MKLAIAVLMMTSALGAGSAAFAAGQGASPTLGAGLSRFPQPGADLTLIDSDEDDEDEGGWLWSGSDDDSACEAEDDNEDDVACAAEGAGNAAKAGTAPPPKNGLFTDGTAPVVQSN